MTDRTLVAGGAGFIGSRLALALAQDRPVTVLDNLTRRGSELNLSKLSAAGVAFVHGDVRCPEDLGDPRVEADTIIDCCAEPSVLAGFNASQRTIQNNLVGTCNLLEVARKRRSRFVFISTSRVYPIATLANLPLSEGRTRFELAEDRAPAGVTRWGIAETFSLTGYRSLYGASKLAGELLVEEYRHAYGLPAVVNRCGVVAGPGQMARSDQGVFALWAAAHVLQRKLKYIGFGGRGLQVRDLIHVDDLVDLLRLQLARFAEVDGHVFNVGGGPDRALSLYETTNLCEAASGNKINIGMELESRRGDVPWFVTDGRSVEQRLGWRPTRSAVQTIEDIVRWIRDDLERLRDVLA